MGQAVRATVEILEIRQLLSASVWNNLSSTSASWNVAANWNPATSYPNSASASADLNVDVAGNTTITLGADITVNALTLGDSALSHGVGQAQTIAGANTLTLDNGASAASITMAAGAVQHAAISSPMVLASDLTITNNSNQLLTLSGSINTAGHAITISGSGPVLISGAITGSGALSSSGTLSLSGANTYSGDTAINSGTLTLIPPTSADPLGGAVSIASGAILAVNPANHALSLTNAFTGSGTVNYTGTARESIRGDWSGFTGTFNINTTAAGKLDAGSSVLGSAATVNIAAGSTFFAAGSATFTNAFNISGPGNTEGFGAIRLDSGATVSGTVTLLSNAAIGSNAGTGIVASPITGGFALSINKAGTGAMVLSGVNTYSGGTIISKGALQISSSAALGSGDVIDNGSLLLNSAGDLTLANNISGTGSITQLGPGAADLSGVNTYSGGTTITAGTLQAGGDGSLGSGDVIDNSSLVFNSTGDITLANNISGSGNVLQLGTGTVSLTGTVSQAGGTAAIAGALVGVPMNSYWVDWLDATASGSQITAALQPGITSNVDAGTLVLRANQVQVQASSEAAAALSLVISKSTTIRGVPGGSLLFTTPDDTGHNRSGNEPSLAEYVPALVGDGIYVYGMEDGHDADYNDAYFAVKVVSVDLDVDSDNNNDFAAPGRTQQEEDVEDVAGDPAKPGKIIAVSDTDLDFDGVPDWGDGFNADGVAGTADDAPPTAAQGMHFVPVVLEIPQGIDLSQARLKLTYSASDPAEVEPTLESGGSGYRLSTEGALRLWTKDGGVTRDKAAFNAGPAGDYVPPTGSGSYGPDDLAKLGFSDTNRIVTLWLEAVAPSTDWGDQPIEVELDVDGDGPVGFLATDQVRVTAITADADVDSDNNNGFAAPDHSVIEDQAEDVANNRDKPGKLVAVNDDDGDSDGIPDYADGFNADGTAGNADDTPPAADQSEQFVPITVEVPAPLDLSKVWLKLDYNASTPGSTITGDMRLWTSQGYVTRTSANFTTAPGVTTAPPPTQPNMGYFVPPTLDGYYGPADLAKLGLSNTNRTVTLYVEALRPSDAVADKTIKVSVDPDGAGEADFVTNDEVRLTDTELAVVSDGGGDHAIDNNDPVASFARIGNWGADDGAGGLDGYNGGAVRNNVGTAANGWDNFIDRDPDRFYVRVVDPTANTSATTADVVVALIGTRAGDGTQDDASNSITLRETGVNTGVFVSESQLLTAPDLTGVAAADQDDGFAVASAITGGTVADEGANDRTQKATIDGAVRVSYGLNPDIRQIPVSQRGASDERRLGSIHVRVFNEPYADLNGNGAYDAPEPFTDTSGNGAYDAGEPFTDANGNGTRDAGDTFTDISGDGVRNTVLGSQTDATAYVHAQIARATIAWAQGGIRFQLAGAIAFVDAPADAVGTNIIADGEFDAPGGVAGFQDLQVLAKAYSPGASPDVVEAVYVGPIQNFLGQPANAFSPIPDWSATNLPVMGENSFAIMGTDLTHAGRIDIKYRTLAHELWHLLTNNYDQANQPYVFAPALTTNMDDHPDVYRRFTHTVETDAGRARAPGSLHARGNRFLSHI